MPMGRVTVTLPAEILSDIDHAEKNRSAFILEAVRRELSRRRRLNLRKSLQNPHVESHANAEAGFGAWAGSLPEEDLSDLVDPATLTPVRWIERKGWKEGGK
jgi:Arc/MetJ-type ribon-helix-helix transcriptional regulator